MAGNDIDYLIHQIYIKYNNSQEDKKEVERVYMAEEVFKENLQVMVKHSVIEDKALLYKEIYATISSDALEIDSSGNITISPKVIKLAEATINKKKEELQNNNTDKNININHSLVEELNKEQYDKLSDEEKKESFSKSTEWIFGSKEKAEEAYENMGALTINDDDLSDVIEKTENGETVDAETYKSRLGEDEIFVDNADVQKIAFSMQAMINGFFTDEMAKVFLISNGDGKPNQINTALIERLASIVEDTNLTVEEIKVNIESLRELGFIDASKKDQIIELAQDKEQFVSYVKMMNLLGRITKSRKDLFKGAEENEYDFNKCIEMFVAEFGQHDKSHILETIEELIMQFSDNHKIRGFSDRIDGILNIVDLKTKSIEEECKKEKQERQKRYSRIALELPKEDIFVCEGENGEPILNEELFNLFTVFLKGEYRTKERLGQFLDLIKATGVDKEKIKSIMNILMNVESVKEEIGRFEEIIDLSNARLNSDVLSNWTEINTFNKDTKSASIKYDSFGSPEMFVDVSVNPRIVQSSKGTTEKLSLEEQLKKIKLDHKDIRKIRSCNKWWRNERGLCI